MKHLINAVLLLITVVSYAQPGTSISIGKIDTLRSQILNETRRIWVYVPASANNKFYTPQVYPVVYLLDAPAHFHFVTGMIQQLGNKVIPEMIVVGIQNTDRTRDLTPTPGTTSPYGQTPEMLKNSGGGDNFLRFIEKELMPYIESSYPVAPYKMFVGHSYGGLLVMHTLLNKPEMFNAYIALDPSLWWDNQVLAGQAISALQQNRFPVKPIYLAIANVMDTKQDIRKIEKDTSSASISMRIAFRLAKAIDKHKKSNQPWHWKYYPEDGHSSVTLIAQYDAFRTFFDGYYLSLPADPNEMKAEIYTNHYQKLTGMMGYKVLPPEVRINQAAYTLMRMERMEQAYGFFKLNVENYPESFMVYDSMGDYYVANGEKEKAIEYFRKALSLKEFPQTRQKLEKLTRAEGNN